MPVQYWFPTCVYRAPLVRRSGEAFTQELHAACQRLKQEDEAGQRWCTEHYAGGYTSYGTQRGLHRSHLPFKELETKVWPHVRRFAARLDMDLSEVNLSMTDCWVNIMSGGAAHPFHAHPSAVLSGTFYVATPAGSSPLELEDPRFENFAGSPPQRAVCRPANSRRVAYEARAGELILFESWLRHQVPPQAGNEQRISISFNYAWV
ncbi:MAG: TIGR02466 family protein [Myxococcales bacterium]